jgi:hypothetical protein
MKRAVPWLIIAAWSALAAWQCAPGAACPPETLGAIEARYSAAILAECADAGSLAACEGASELRAKRWAEERDAGCR